MTTPDRSLDELTRLLSQCLGRIDEEANRLVDQGDDVDFGAADRVEDDTAALQQLIDELVVVVANDDEVDVNRLVAQTAENCLQALNVPVVVSQNLTSGDVKLVAPRPLVTVAVQRALVLAFEQLDAGDQVSIVTRSEVDAVAVEIECSTGRDHPYTEERSETLREFVADFGGRCTVRGDDRHRLFIVLELPRVPATEPRE